MKYKMYVSFSAQKLLVIIHSYTCNDVKCLVYKDRIMRTWFWFICNIYMYSYKRLSLRLAYENQAMISCTPTSIIQSCWTYVQRL